MGPNGSGKSTLAAILAGREGYDITAGQVLYNGQNLLDMDPEERAREGLFLAFQYPVELPGVPNNYFLRAAVNATRKHRGEAEIDAKSVPKRATETLNPIHIDDDLLKRPVNDGFSA